ncbi:MAG: hypothetical protein RIS89_967 [Bacteroidota bacterium]
MAAFEKILNVIMSQWLKMFCQVGASVVDLTTQQKLTV